MRCGTCIGTSQLARTVRAAVLFLCLAELPDVRANTPVASVTRDPKKRNVTVVTASGQKST